MDDEQNRPAAVGQVERPVRPGADERWYCLSRDGLATLCSDEEDAMEVAAESWVLYPQNGPYRVAQMVDAGAVATAVAAERERWRLLLSAEHDYMGDCPEPGRLDARDPNCSACRALGDWRA